MRRRGGIGGMWKFGLALFGLFVVSGGIVIAAAYVDYHHRAFIVTAVAPIVVTDMSTGGGFVVGTDGVARTCPDAKYVAEYLRAEGKGLATLLPVL